MCKNYSLYVNVQAKKSSFSFPFPHLPPPPPPPTGGREKGKETLDFAARTLTLNKQYLHSSHQIYVEKYYFISKVSKCNITYMHAKMFLTATSFSIHLYLYIFLFLQNENILMTPKKNSCIICLAM